MALLLTFTVSHAVADAIRLNNLITRLLLAPEAGPLSYERSGDTVRVTCSSKRAYQLSDALREYARRDDRPVETRAAASAVIASLDAAMRSVGMVPLSPLI